MRTAFITGGTAGIGEASVRAFVGAGWRVVTTGRRGDRLAALADELGREQVLPLAFDIRDRAALDAAIASLPADFAGIDLLVNNAGLALGTAPAQGADLGSWQTMIDTNVSALVAVTRATARGAAPRTIRQPPPGTATAR